MATIGFLLIGGQSAPANAYCWTTSSCFCSAGDCWGYGNRGGCDLACWWYAPSSCGGPLGWYGNCGCCGGTRCTTTTQCCDESYSCSGRCGTVYDGCGGAHDCGSCCAANYGAGCTSAANNCGQTNSGTIQCNGTCSASKPADVSSVSISGTISNIPSGATSTVKAGNYTSNTVNPSGGNYTISSVPTNTGNLTFYASDLSSFGYAVSPGTTTISTACTNITGKNFTYSCVSSGTCSNSCTYNGSSWSCQDACGNTISCPAPPNAAGVVQSQGSINAGPQNKITQAGNDPGAHLVSYVQSANLNDVSYQNILNTVLKNSNLNTTTNLDANPNCSGGGVVSSNGWDIIATMPALLTTFWGQQLPTKPPLLFCIPPGTLPYPKLSTRPVLWALAASKLLSLSMVI